MKRKDHSVALCLGLAVLYALVFAARAWWNDWMRAVHLEAGKASYLHYEFVEARLWTRDAGWNARWRAEAPSVRVLRDGGAVETVAGIKTVRLAYDPDSGTWTGRWPCPWNAPAATYEFALANPPEGAAGRLKSRPFLITRREPRGLPPGFAALTWESVAPLQSLRVRTPSGRVGDWRGMLDWAQYIGANAFWMLGGQTPGPNGAVWVEDNLAMIPEVARECHRRGLLFGVYAQCYLTMSPKERLARYRYARDAKDGATFQTRSISLLDPRRPDDVAEFLGRFSGSSDVDGIGVDYIRNALGGYELAEDFYSEMPGVHPPPEWARLSHEERMLFFARKKIMRRDMKFIDAWQWWRAHRAAEVVRRIKEKAGGSKLFWAFSLTWDKGWHHGQDAVMFNDAGVDADALMLYEATAQQYEALVKDWHAYIRRGDAQLVVGDVVDWPLHQRAPDGPGDFYRRMARAVDGIYADGPARGIFIHDLDRALHGRLGPWSTLQWMDEAKRAVQYVRSRSAGGAERRLTGREVERP